MEKYAYNAVPSQEDDGVDEPSVDQQIQEHSHKEYAQGLSVLWNTRARFLGWALAISIFLNVLFVALGTLWVFTPSAKVIDIDVSNDMSFYGQSKSIK